MILFRKGRGVDLWQEELDVWGMIDNDRRCYEMCIRYVVAKSIPQDEKLMNTQDSVL